jgi:hypothetical protein
MGLTAFHSGQEALRSEFKSKFKVQVKKSAPIAETGALLNLDFELGLGFGLGR